MKAVLIGADLMYRQDGKLVPIEINTNTAWDAENRVEESYEEIFDFESFKAYLDQNKIKEVWIDGAISPILIEYFGRRKGINIVRKSDEELAEAEDKDGLLLLRTSYSDEALVDSFCRDKALFLDAIKDFDFGCDYVLKTDEGLEGSIAEIVDNGDYPNFILKYRYPYYDTDEYPKLLKLSSQRELKKFLKSEEMPVDYILMPFYFNADKLWEQEGEKRIKFFRHFSMFTLVDGSSLEAVPVGTYTKLCGNLENIKCKYSSLGVLDSESRQAFLDTWTTRAVEDVLAEKGDLVLMADDTWKPVEELEVGDEIKSLDIPNEGDVDIRKHTGDYNVNYDTFVEESSYGIGEITAIRKSSRVITKVGLVFTDGTDWWDTANSSYPTLDPEDETIYFKTLDMMVSGDKVILLKAENTENPEFEVKELEKIERSRQAVEGYGLSVDGSHLFLTKAPDEESAYVSIEHNEDDETLYCNVGEVCNSAYKTRGNITSTQSLLLRAEKSTYNDGWRINSVNLCAEQLNKPQVNYIWNNSPILECNENNSPVSRSLEYRGIDSSNGTWIYSGSFFRSPGDGLGTAYPKITITFSNGSTLILGYNRMDGTPTENWNNHVDRSGLHFTASAGLHATSIDFSYVDSATPVINQ